jgi:hypothetical protein
MPGRATSQILFGLDINSCRCQRSGGPRGIRLGACPRVGGMIVRNRFMKLAAVTAAVVVGTSGTAYAHECFIANRSAQGNASATHSDRWVTVTVEGFVNSPDFPPGVDPDCFLDYWLSHGGPASFTVRRPRRSVKTAPTRIWATARAWTTSRTRSGRYLVLRWRRACSSLAPI